MDFKKFIGALLACFLVVGTLFACSSSTSSIIKPQTSDGAETTDSKTTIKIATQSPLSGGSANIGEAIKLGAQMKLEEEQAKFEELGFSLQLVPYDDQGDPKKGVSNANLISEDRSIYGVIGHYNSAVAIPASEVYEKYNIVMVSPANTANEITDRGLKTVNRIVAHENFQGPAGAQFAVKELGAKKIFVIHDKTSYGTGLSEAFIQAAKDLGAEIVGEDSITVGDKDFNDVISKVKSAAPDLVFFGGLYSEGGILVKQARENGIDVPFMGGDGLNSSGLVDIAGEAVINTYFTSIAGDSNATEAGKKFAEEYKTKFDKEQNYFSIYGYDSMGVLLQGLEDAIKTNDGKLPSKADVVTAVRGIKDYEGALTTVTFDDNGDNINAKVFIYRFDQASYLPVQVGEVHQ
ncbi:ABC transporter substrate-binding protein [Ureibacillus massiliensis 4400831 = CIP 108448 = CCUG 49529]|uniref:ABC transporter substrate-binding protein n=1 Tax=Ureibacillus massiliensis 4400831 = CIP 108448 = CCUG 49529 TaxID=1211035 RepID=A0A0A3J481_9BACL|nr:branched-chain amino acid ABC transporter substrate-binding protein [Ureibacillus massiliensis]KGR89993.1 ABC transporter substrate-binding protein [Ureibacillus massiliensis 4400831 = CIP 108448 = CCUG 49529]